MQRCDCGRNLRGTGVALRGECAARGNGRARYRSASRLLHDSRSKEGRRTGPRQRIRAVAEGTTPTAHPFEANRCKNVRVEPVALASEDGESTLFVVDGRDTGCNSLRPPAVDEPTHGVAVKTIKLDTYVTSLGLRRVDFIKIDAEGAELEILEGARSVL